MSFARPFRWGGPCYRHHRCAKDLQKLHFSQLFGAALVHAALWLGRAPMPALLNFDPTSD